MGSALEVEGRGAQTSRGTMEKNCFSLMNRKEPEDAVWLIKLPPGCPSLKAKVLAKAKDLLEGLYIPPDPGAPQGSPGAAGAFLVGGKPRNVLINLLPQLHSTTFGSDWTDGPHVLLLLGAPSFRMSDHFSPVPMQCSVMYIQCKPGRKAYLSQMH